MNNSFNFTQEDQIKLDYLKGNISKEEFEKKMNNLEIARLERKKAADAGDRLAMFEIMIEDYEIDEDEIDL